MSTEENSEEQMGGNIMNLLGLGSQNEKIIIKGQDFENMRRLAEDIEASLDNLQSINNVSLNIQSASPEVHLNFDMDYINRSGFSLNDISAALLTFGREYTSGATFSDGTDSYSIILKYEDDEGRSDDNDKTIDDLINLEVSSSEGSIAYMDDLADIIYSYGMGNIHRENQEKQITVTYAFKMK
jgi:multidrug efflux pump subunit AcrB